MKKKQDPIEQFLKRVRARRTEQIWIDNLCAFLAVGFGGGLVLSVIAMVVPFYAAVWTAVLIVLCVIAAAVWTGRRRPTLTQAALSVDALGYQEVFVTAYLERENDSVFAKLTRKQAETVIPEIPVKKRFPLVIRWKRAGFFLLLALLFACSMMVETDARAKARYEHHVEEKANSEIAAIEKVEQELKQADPSGTETEELLDELAQTKEELSEASEYEEVEKIMNRALFKMSEAANSENQTVNQTLSEAVTKQNEQRATDIEQLAKEVQEALEQAEDGTAREKADAEEKLSELASALSDSELSDAAKAYAQSDQTASDAKTAAKAASSAMATALASGNGSSSSNGNGETTSDSDSGTGSGTGNQSQSGTSTGNTNDSDGTGSGSGNSTGNGTGNGTGGSGSGGGWNRGSSEGSERENNTAEQVTIPENELGTDENLTGKGTSDGQTSYEASDQSLAWSGDKVSYGQVSGEYKEKAYSALDSATYPDSMKDKIKTYFDGLE